MRVASSCCHTSRLTAVPLALRERNPAPRYEGAIENDQMRRKAAQRSVRQFTEPLFSTVLDSMVMSKPRRNRYFNVSTWPVPSSETP